MAARPQQPPKVDLETIMRSLCEHVRMLGSVKWAELARMGLTKPFRDAASARFVKAGFEVLPHLVRIPIAEQIRLALAQQGQLPLRGMQKILAGCTAKEVSIAIDHLVRSGKAIRILRTKAQWLAPADADVLTKDELHALNRCVTEWSRQTNQAKAARRRGLYIWRPDVRALQEVLGTFDLHPQKTMSSSVDIRSRLLETIREQVNPTVGMAFVPAVVQSLQLPVDQVQHLLVEEAIKGHLELRPDAGSAHFTEAELSAAPCAPDGSRLLWIRLPEAIA